MKHHLHQIPPEAGFPGLPIDDSSPDLTRAFSFFNDEIRPRREFHADLGVRGEWRKVEFGKPGGELYPVCTSLPRDLKEFGLGVAMYFQTLELLAITFLFCGIMQAQAIKYYRSLEYSDEQPGVFGLLRGSAICTRRDPVCLDPECKDIGVKNFCEASQVQATCDLSMTVILLVIFAVVSFVQNSVSTALDESMQTAQDYSVIVDDPGPEDGDIQIWADFFSQFGHVTFVTIAKDNGPLIKAMAARRVIMREIIMLIGNGEASLEEDDDGIVDNTWGGKDFETVLQDSDLNQQGLRGQSSSNVFTKLGLFGMKSLTSWKGELAKANLAVQAALDAAADKPYVPSKVFVTFETEAAQRQCLKALRRSTVEAAFDVTFHAMPSHHVFRGTNVLAVHRAPEPAEIFYEDVQITFFLRVRQQARTFLFTVFLVFGSIVVCQAIKTQWGPNGTTAWITLTNIAVPVILRRMIFALEDHVSLNDQQISLFMKLSFFRWLNSAIVLFVITEPEEFLTVQAIEQVKAVLIADAITTPLLRTVDPLDSIKQLVVSRYALTQEKMNSYFFGQVWYPAERYADLTKTLFLALFYSALFPAGLFLTCLSFSFCYTVDKYSLLRTWRTPAELGDSIMKISRGHMVFAVYCHAVMSMVFFSEFPFDNLCEDRDAGELSPQQYSHASAAFNVTSPQVFTPCDQSFYGRVQNIFTEGAGSADNAVHRKQKRIVRVFVTLVTVLTVLFLGLLLGHVLMNCYRPFHKIELMEAQPNETPFTACHIQAYIPVIRHPRLAFPLVAADVDSFESRFLPFQFPREELYHVQSLFNKNELPGFTPKEMRALFSEVMYFAPPKDLQDHDRKGIWPGKTGPLKTRKAPSNGTPNKEGYQYQEVESSWA